MGHPLDGLYESHNAALERIRELESTLSQYQRSFPHCEKHKPVGTRSGPCCECLWIELQSALSEICYATEEPNEHEYSTYDAFPLPSMVVERVRERMRELEAALVVSEREKAELRETLDRTSGWYVRERNTILDCIHRNNIPTKGGSTWANQIAEYVDALAGTARDLAIAQQEDAAMVRDRDDALLALGNAALKIERLERESPEELERVKNARDQTIRNMQKAIAILEQNLREANALPACTPAERALVEAAVDLRIWARRERDEKLALERGEALGTLVDIVISEREAKA